jgi:hypothetical protein
MASPIVWLCAALTAQLASASQPSAQRPVPAPMRDLQWGALNFLHTTDTHGWHGGHLQESQYSADWGDYISFAEHMRRKADEKGVDLLLVDTGDRIEGNGLYDGSTPKGQYTYDIYREQDVDIICTGNHELYQPDSVEREWTRTAPNFKGRYIASNLDYRDPGSGESKAVAQRYHRFTTKNQKLDVISLGFLFDFTGNANNSVVQAVEDTIQEAWFQDVIHMKPDIFVVIGHIGLHMAEFEQLLFGAIRKQNPTTPIVFLGGHTHIRDATAYDDNSFALESGRYFETIGWMSVDGISKSHQADATTLSFSRRYIDNNLLGLYHHTGLNESTFPTEHGRNVTRWISDAREALDLDYRYGCAPQDYWMTRAPYPSNASIFTLLESEVLPSIIRNKDRLNVPHIGYLNTGGVRFDIFKGPFTKDSTFIVSPFVSKFNYVPDVPYDVAKKVLDLLNSGGNIFEKAKLDQRLLSVPEQWSMTEDIVYEPTQAELLTDDLYGAGQVPLRRDPAREPVLIAGYTTNDDFGTDGDDAVHKPINFYKVPNCVQAKIAFPKNGTPDTVDVVFIDFIQPWVLVALAFAGHQYSDKDVQVYTKDTFTDLLAGWIKDNWQSGC